MANNSVYIVDIMEAVADAVSTALALNPVINYTYGDKDEILSKMKQLQGAPSTKSKAFPFIGITMPFKEDRGVQGHFYGIVTFPEIIIAARSNNTDDFPQRYTKTMKPIVYPIYEEFLRQIVASRKFNVQELRNIKHTKSDVPNITSQKSGLNDYIDAIVINGLTLTPNQSVC